MLKFLLACAVLVGLTLSGSAQESGSHLYMFQFKYTPQSAKAQIDNPQDRTIPVRNLIEGYGGKLIGFYLYLAGTSEYDGMAIAELPNDNVARGIEMYTRSTGAVEKQNVIPMVTGEQWKAVMQQATQTRTGYTTPTETKQ